VPAAHRRSWRRSSNPTAQSIRNWVGQAERDAGRRGNGLTTAEREELNQLRRENRQLRLERDILSKAAAWFGTLFAQGKFAAAHAALERSIRMCEASKAAALQ
jgi:transposase-like protein